MNDEELTAYPLKWPAGWPRATMQRRAKFGRSVHVPSTTGGTGYHRKAEMTVATATQRLREELAIMGASNVVISTDIPLRRDGGPISGRRAPDDQGVAVYWTMGKEPQCIAIDIYDRIADNIAAAAATINAMRAIERHGGAQIMRRAWSGFKALPGSTGPTMTTEQAARAIATSDGPPWERIVSSKSDAQYAARRWKSLYHPDAEYANAEKWTLGQTAIAVLSSHHGVSL